MYFKALKASYGDLINFNALNATKITFMKVLKCKINKLNILFLKGFIRLAMI